MSKLNPTQGGSSYLGRELLHDYQNRGVQFVKDNHGCALFLDMGA